MAKEQEEKEKILTLDERTTNTLFDKNGNKVLSSEFMKQEHEDDAAEYKTTNIEHFEASDGTFLSAAQISAPESRGGVTLKRCDGCEDEVKTFSNWILHRNQPQIILSPEKKSRGCFSCRRNFCERHFVISQDRRIRCKICNRRFRRNQFCLRILKFIFLRKI